MDTPPPPPAPGTSTPTPKAKSRRGPLAIGCLILILLLLAGLVGAAVAVWWVQRPMKPVELSEPEWQVVQEKLQPAEEEVRPDDTYVPGVRHIVITERELNGLLERETGMGDRVRFALDRGAINAYVALPVPEDFPLLGGVTVRARGRFAVDARESEPAVARLEDVSVFGISLPSAWLGGIKGRDLIGETLGTGDGGLIPGIREFTVMPGEMRIELEE